MARKKTSSGINLQMYKHFAIITLVVTGAMAMFADGENREVAEAEANAKTAQAAQTIADIKPKLIMKAKPRSSSGYNGGGGGYSGGSEFGSGSDSSIIPDSISDNNGGRDTGFLAQMGLTQESFSQLTERQKRAVRIRAQGMMSKEERDRYMQEALAASAARSGHDGEN